MTIFEYYNEREPRITKSWLEEGKTSAEFNEKVTKIIGNIYTGLVLLEPLVRDEISALGWDDSTSNRGAFLDFID